MRKNNKLYYLNHCTYLNQYHIIWTPKYRRKVLVSKYIKDELRRMFKYIAKWKQLRIISWHIGDEHIHLYIIIPPKYSVSYIVAVLKTKSSTWIKKKSKRIPKGPFWCRGFFCTTIGINEYVIKTYIEEQNRIRIKNLELNI